MSGRRFTILLLLLAALALPALAGAAPHRTARTYVPVAFDESNARFRPHHLLLSSDATLWMTRIRWRHYGKLRAVGVGRAHVNDCRPFCAAGKVHKVRARMSWSHPVTCDARRVYSRVTIRFARKRPKFVPAKISRKAFCPS
jgi:hypothetical protein